MRRWCKVGHLSVTVADDSECSIRETFGPSDRRALVLRRKAGSSVNRLESDSWELRRRLRELRERSAGLLSRLEAGRAMFTNERRTRMDEELRSDAAPPSSPTAKPS